MANQSQPVTSQIQERLLLMDWARVRALIFDLVLIGLVAGITYDTWWFYRQNPVLGVSVMQQIALTVTVTLILAKRHMR